MGQQDRPPGSGGIRVVVADDHALFREGLALAISEDPSMDLVGEAGDGDEALDLIERLRPDLALLDVQMPGRDGLAVCEHVSSAGPGTRVLMLSAFDDPALIDRARGAGAHGYLSKDASRDEIRTALAAIARGEHVFPGLSS